MLTLPIETTRLHLRELRDADVDDMVAYKSIPENVAYVPYSPLSRDVVAEKIRTTWTAEPFEEVDDAICLGIEERESRTLIGDVVIIWRGEADRVAEVGYILHPAWQGRGLAAEAVAALLSAAFAQLDLHRVFARLDERNTASAALLERLGFRQEARHVRAMWFKDQWSTMLIYAMLADEWAERKTS